MRGEFAQLPGVPETALSPRALETLPRTAQPAPWRVIARVLLWMGRPDEAARAAIEAAVPLEVREDATPTSVIGGLIRYEATPVGGYREVVGIVIYRRGRSIFGHVPFIAVDSPASVVGGRTNWALPKTLASFTGGPADTATMAAVGADWRIEATARLGRPPLPVFAPKLVPLVQLGPRGSIYAVRPGGYGLVRRARVEVHVDAQPTLRDWFPAGACSGMLLTRLIAVFDPAVPRADGS
jgi:hypothetical protein